MSGRRNRRVRENGTAVEQRSKRYVSIGRCRRASSSDVTCDEADVSQRVCFAGVSLSKTIKSLSGPAAFYFILLYPGKKTSKSISQ